MPIYPAEPASPTSSLEEHTARGNSSRMRICTGKEHAGFQGESGLAEDCESHLSTSPAPPGSYLPYPQLPSPSSRIRWCPSLSFLPGQTGDGAGTAPQKQREGRRRQSAPQGEELGPLTLTLEGGGEYRLFPKHLGNPCTRSAKPFACGHRPARKTRRQGQATPGPGPA